MEITYDQTKLKVVKLDEVRPNSWNPKEKDHENIKKIEQNIERIGFNEPIRVRENDGFEIIDGEQRWTAASNLGLKEVVIYNEGKLTDEEARAATLWWQVQVPFDDIKLAYEVAALADINIEVPYSDVEIADFKELANFNFDDYNFERPDDDPNIRTINIKTTKEQYDIIMLAIEGVVARDTCSDSQALERICADFLSK
jgi:hypothetical protein